jgi:CSLREA domain-containing protein
MTRSRLLLFILAPSLVALALAAAPAPAAPAALTYVVNSPADVPDVNPGNGVCETAPTTGVCTLRAAIQEINARPGGDTISLQSATTYLLTRPGDDNSALNGDLDISRTVTILGAGAASTIIDGNGSVTGDRVFQIKGTAVISGVTIQRGNGTTGFGGSIQIVGDLSLINSAVMSNTVGGSNAWGGGIYSSGSLTLANSIVSGNTTGSSNPYGGGIMVGNGYLTLLNSTVSGNTTPGLGGGVAFSGLFASLSGSTVSGNGANSGGGVYQRGNTMTLLNSTLSGNYSYASGGGIYNWIGTTSLFNATITDNYADADLNGSGGGGGVSNTDGGGFNFVNSIIAGNHETLGHSHDVVYGDCAGTITSQGNSIIYLYDSGSCTINGSFALTNPLLGPLANNGGATKTHALLKGSPAIDTGNAGGCTDSLGAPITRDQRGFARPFGARCDIGAYEYRTDTYLPLIRR